MSVTPVPSAARAKRAIGAMFFSFFGTLWLAGADAIARQGGDWLLAPIVAGGAGLLAAAWLRLRANRVAKAADDATPRARRVARVFHAVNFGQWALIVVLANVLRHVGLDDWVLDMVMAVVGLHFLPLAAAMDYRPHLASGVALIALAATYPFLAAAGPQSAAGPLGAGLILWASALYALTAGARAGDGEAVALRA